MSVENLLFSHTNGYDLMPLEEEGAMNAYCEEYKDFLAKGKTERECVDYTVALLDNRGYRPFVRGEKVQPGDKIYRVVAGKAIMAAVIGEKPLSEGAAVVGAHIDCPRLDLRPNPLYEDKDMALMKTHYYGGVRKYQWVTIPLELHGVVCKIDGTTVKVCIGQDPGDPQLTIPDLLPHLADGQAKQPLYTAIGGEDLNLLVGSRPYGTTEDKKRFKLSVLKVLNEKYGITEADFLSAELCAVPAFAPRDIGLDRSMVGAYGQDDRVCSYAALKALVDCEETLKRTGVCLLVDKEEIGSYGITGMDSAYFDVFMSDLCEAQGVSIKTCYENSFCLSADVTTAYDPNHPDVFSKQNCGRMNGGIGVSKYTGSRGKSGASDAGAELLGYIRRVFAENGVVWQMTELGKIDVGGGGTIAHYMARRGIPTLDAGTPILAMHAPMEVAGKLDCYMTYKAAKAVYND